MPRFVVVDKKSGETPLQCLEIYRAQHTYLQNTPITYAGRLDPMASGKLLLLIGDECKRRSRYDDLDKEYEFEVLLGFSSDTGDILGRIEQPDQATIHPSMSNIYNVIRTLVGKHTFAYPIYSSKTVSGIPLFKYAQQGRINTIKVPTKEIHIHRLHYLGRRIISVKSLRAETIERIQTFKPDTNSKYIGADFRKDEIISDWTQIRDDASDYLVVRFSTTVTSGTYIRMLSEHIANTLGIPGLAYSIRRTRIGRFVSIYKGFGIWSLQL